MQSVPIFTRVALAALTVLFAVHFTGAQPSPAPPPRTVFYDHQGREISNNEFVDIRMANPHYPDATITRTLPDGTTEFRLQKIPQEGMQAPDFTVRTLGGEVISAEHLRGKVVVLNFWFIGCPACMAEMPKLNLLKARFAGRDDVVFLAMTADKISAVKRFTERERFDYTHAAEAGPAMEMFKFVAYPKNIVISKSGEMVYWRTVVHAWDRFESVIREELKN